MNWKKKIAELSNPQIKRIRKTIRGFPLSTQREIPLDSAIPKDNGLCRRPLPRDFLYVEGITDKQHPKKIFCGPFSQELLNRVETEIKANQRVDLTR